MTTGIVRDWPQIVLGLPSGHVPHSERRWWIYIHRDALGQPLYVGIAMHPRDRNKQHVSKSDWWPAVASIDLQGPWLDRPEALRAEERLIRQLDPPFNVIYTPRNCRPLTVSEAKVRLSLAELRLEEAREALAAAEHRELVEGAA